MSMSLPPPIPAPSQAAGSVVITGPLGIADLLDRTFRALRARFGILILSAAIVTVPLGLLTVMLSGRFMTGYGDLLQYSMTDPTNAEIAAEQLIGNSVGYFGALMIVSFLSILGSALVTLMSIFHIQRFLHGENSTFGEAWGIAIRRMFPLIGMLIAQYFTIGVITMGIAIAVGLAFFLVALVMGGAMAALENQSAGMILAIGLIIVFIIGYIFLILLLLAPTLYFAGRWIAAGPSLLIEKSGPIASLRRSWQLTGIRKWKSILFLFLLTAISFIVIGIPVWTLQAITAIFLPTQIALLSVISTAIAYMLNLFYQPFYATGLTLFYYDLRVRNEAYDVALRVNALESEVAADATPA